MTTDGHIVEAHLIRNYKLTNTALLRTINVHQVVSTEEKIDQGLLDEKSDGPKPNRAKIFAAQAAGCKAAW